MKSYLVKFALAENLKGTVNEDEKSEKSLALHNSSYMTTTTGKSAE